MEQTPRRPRRTISIDGFSVPSQPLRPSTPPARHHRPDSRPGLTRTAAPMNPAGNLTRTARPSVLQSPTTEAPKTKHKKRSFKTYTKRAALTFVALILLTGGWMGFKVYRNIAKITNNSNPFSLLSAFQPVTLKGQDTGRVNILLAGNSTDDPGHDGSDLYDSIMILSLDTRDNSAFMLSVPRDLLVDIPSMGYQKINAAATITNFRGEGLPNGGMGQLESLLESHLGITINYYALIDYTAFRDTVNAVGGVTINISSSDKRGLYDPNIAKVDGGPLKLPNGPQQLNGQTALNLARARGDSSHSYGFPGSDFDRTAHQRQLLLALKSKVASSSVLADPLKIGKLADAIGNNISTDMKLNEMETFYSLTRKLGDNQIASYNINNLNNQQMLVNYITPEGQEALVPAAGVDDFSAIQAGVKKLTSTDPLVKESASVVVLNGGDIVGLAKRQATSLTSKGLNVLTTADAPTGMTDTTIITGGGAAGKPGTKAALQKLYGVTPTSNAALTKQYPSADFIIILGTNFADPSSTSTSTISNQ